MTIQDGIRRLLCSVTALALLASCHLSVVRHGPGADYRPEFTAERDREAFSKTCGQQISQGCPQE